MAFFAGIVLLVLASSDVTLGQRKHSRTIPVGADVKTGLHFDCPEEFGYYPHPADCTQYYVCVFGGALLESCTGGLMYSHELQTCDWPRNVGCDGTAEVAATTPTVTYSSSSSRTPESSKSRYSHPPPPPPPAQPAAVVTSRGQPRQLHRTNQEELIKQKQQQQLYVEAEEALPPAEEIESDRQQRVYRGQPSTVGQVQRDRDGLRHHTNAIPSSSGRGEKIGVISFGTQQQSIQQYRDVTDSDSVLTNSLAIEHHKRRKRQIERSRNYDSEVDTWHAISDPRYIKHQRPPSLNFRAPPKSNQRVRPNVYKPNPSQNDHKRTKNFHFTSNHGGSGVDFRSNSFTPRNPYNQNYQYFHLDDNITEFLAELGLANEGHHYEDYNFSGLSKQPPHHNSDPFIPSAYFVSDKQKYEIPSYVDTPVYLKAITLPNNPPTTARTKTNPTTIDYITDRPSNYYDVFVVRQEESLANKPATIVRPNDHFVQNYYDTTPLHANNSAKINVETVKPDSEDKTKLRPLNTALAPCVDCYHDHEIVDGPDTKPSTNSSKTNEDKSYLDEYYDYREPNDTDYYYDEISTLSYRDQQSQVSKPSTTSEPIITPSLNTPPPVFKSSEAPLLNGAMTTSSPSVIGHNSTVWSMPSTKPKTETPRQRLTSTTDNDYQQPVTSRVENRSNRPVEQSHSTVTTSKPVYNTSSHYDSSRYDPYYALYDDDVDLYKDVEYSQHYNNEPSTPQQTYRGSSGSSSHHSLPQDKAPRRGTAAYVQNTYSTTQDIYQPSAVQGYNDDNHYANQDDDQTAYHQTSKQTSRGDRNELNYIEESATTKRITTTTTVSTTTTTPRPYTTQKSTRAPARSPNSANANEVQSTHYILSEDRGYFHAAIISNNTGIARSTRKPSAHHPLDNVPDISLKRPIVNQPAPFTFPEHLTTPKMSSSFHYITKPSKSTSIVSTAPTHSKDSRYVESDNFNNKIIVPTTYAPSILSLKSFLHAKSNNNNNTSNSNILKLISYFDKSNTENPTILDQISPSAINNQLSSATNNASDYVIDLDIISETYLSDTTADNQIIPSSSTESLKERGKLSYLPMTTPRSLDYSTETDDTDSTESYDSNSDEVNNASWLLLLERLNTMGENKTAPKTKTLEPTLTKPLSDVLRYESKLLSYEKQNPFNPSNPAESVTKTFLTNSSRTTPIPTRVSRVNTAIKSIIAFGEQQRQYTKCNNNQTPTAKCNKVNQRVSSRGRGTAHYSSSGPGETIPTVNVNRGTPPARSRPTLKPSTSIVSKAAEYIDIYRYPPRRPEPIYPQPQPDKTAAKCRKDVCLLPDCSCGGKEIPGDLPVHEVPQMVLLTFDDAVNDLNMGYYAELFENGRVNPNGCPIVATFYVSHEWTDYSQVQNLYADGHEMASHTVSHSFGEQFSQKKWTKEVAGQREILSAYGGVHLEDVRGMRAPFLSVGGNKMFKMLYDSNFTYDSSMPIYENKPPSWPYTLDYKLFHDCMIPPCPTRSYPGVWEVPMVMWQDLNGGRCSMGDACSNPPDADGVFKMLMKNFERHYTTSRAPFGLFYHAAWFTQPHHKEGFIQFLDTINTMKDVWLLTNWQAIQWVRDPTPNSRLNSFQPFGCNYPERPKRCNNPKVCNLWHKTGVRYMRTCQPCPDIYPWTGNTGIRSSRIDNELEEN